MLGPSGSQVAWQQLRDGSVCVAASLAANDDDDTYTLQSGAPTTATLANSVSVRRDSGYIELSNGLTGVRVPTVTAQSAASPANSLAPIAGLYVGGSWVGSSSSLQNGTLNQNGNTSPGGSVSFCTTSAQSVVESGPILTTIASSLTCTRPSYSYGSTVLRTGGVGFFNSEITVYAGAKSVIASAYTDLDVKWQFDFTSAYSTQPNLIAWRGHSTADIACGYYLAGGTTPTIYPASHSRGEMTALRDISYSTTKIPLYYGTCTGRSINQMANYISGSGSDSAFAQWLLNDSQSGSYPVVGLWTGAGSKHIAGLGHIGFATSPSGLTIYQQSALFGPDASWRSTSGWEIGIFTGLQSDVPSKTQHGTRPAAILNEMNGLRGPLRLTKLYANTLAYADPVGGWKWPFLAESAMGEIVTKLNTNTTYYNAVSASGAGTEGTRFIDWGRHQDSTRRSAILTASTSIKTSIDKWILGDGRFDRSEHYYQGLYQFIRNVDNFHAIIKDIESTAAQVAEAKRWLGMGVSLANDSDYFVYDAARCIDGCGNENQIYQHVVYRNLLALVMSHHPSVTPEILKRATDDLGSLLNNYWNSTGSGKASTGYQSNYAEPSVALMLAAIKKGIIASSSPYTNLAASINWDLSSLTPQEPRFNNRRKAYSNGDGNTEAATRLGVLGSAFNSGTAMWGWRSQDTASRYTHGSFYFPTVGMIDDEIAQVNPQLGSLYMNGYHASLRTGWETVNETAAWFITGGWYNDHKHRDNGQVSIYAHRAPLSIDWNANLYSPQTAGGYMHSRAVKESQLSVAWDGTMTSYGSPDSEWGTAAATEFGKFNYGSFSRSTFGGTWTRDVRLLSHAASYPVIIIRDSFTGTDASVSKIVSSTHMATGSVAVNGSNVTPTTRNYDAGQFPSCTAGASLLAGLNRLQFTGQTWAQHATSGIDWDAYVNVSSAASYCLGNWSHIEHASREKSEYQSANGASFRERQHILRVKTSDAALETILLPWRKGESATFTVTNAACGTQIVRGTHTLCSSADKVQWTDGTDYSLMATGTASVSYQGMTISGGPGEIRTNSGSYVAIVDGLTASTRTITLPAGTWYPHAAAVSVSGNQFRLFHDGTTGAPRQVSFSSTESGGVVSLGFAPPSGAAEVRISLDGVAIAQEPCASPCALSIRAPSGIYTMQHQWIDSNGAVLSASSGKSITI